MRKGEDREARESRLASGWTVEGGRQDAEPDPQVAASGLGSAGSRSLPTEAARVDGARGQLSRGMMVVLGLIGLVYLCYTLVWFSWAKYYSDINAAIAETSGVFGSIGQQAVFWAAPLAPILWFCSALLFNRGTRARNLVIWLIIGLVILVPLPLFDLRAAA